MKHNKRNIAIVLVLALCVACVLTLVACDFVSPEMSVTYDDTHKVYEGDTLDSLRPYLTVKYTNAMGTTTEVESYVLSGELLVGDCIVTVRYGTFIQNINVTVYPLSTDDDDIVEDDDNKKDDDDQKDDDADSDDFVEVVHKYFS